MIILNFAISRAFLSTAFNWFNKRLLPNSCIINFSSNKISIST